MATITYVCHHCDQSTRDRLAADQPLVCQHCGTHCAWDAQWWQPSGLQHCLVCPSRDLFVRKDFSPRLGLGIVLLGFAASTVAWAYYQIALSFAILFATAFVDLILYLTMGNLVECYCCHAQYRGLPEEGHGGFNLDVHERHRQAAARRSELPTSASTQ